MIELVLCSQSGDAIKSWVSQLAGEMVSINYFLAFCYLHRYMHADGIWFSDYWMLSWSSIHRSENDSNNFYEVYQNETASRKTWMSHCVVTFKDRSLIYGMCSSHRSWEWLAYKCCHRHHLLWGKPVVINTYIASLATLSSCFCNW